MPALSIIKNLLKKKAITIVEVVLSIGLFSIFSTSVFYVTLSAIDGDEKIEQSNKALLYAQEGLEAARQMRDRNFLLLTDGDHGLEMIDNEWRFIQAPEDIDGYYYRTVTVDDVYRDLNGEIADSGVLDPDMKKISSRIDWTYKTVLPRSIELQTYLSDWRGDDWLETDCAEFSAGFFTDTETIETAGPPTDNCAIKLTLEEEESSFLVSANVGSHGRNVIVSGDYAYVAVNSNSYGLMIVDVSDPQNPSIVDEVNIGGKGMAVGKIGNYVFVGVENKSKGLAVVNVSNPSNATLAKQLNIGGYGSSVATNGSYIYVGLPSPLQLLAINVSSPTNPVIASSTSIPGAIYNMKLVGAYLYAGLDYDWQGFRIFDISNPAVPTVASNLGLNEEVNAVETQGPYAFLGTEARSFYVVDISDPSTPSTITSIPVPAEIQDLAISGDYIYGAMNDNGANLISINISDPTDPYVVYSKDLGGKGTSIFADDSHIYQTIEVNNKGLVINGTTVISNALTGNYISSPLDTGSPDPKYNYIKWSYEETPGSTVKIQIRTSETAEGLESAEWVGIDGTSGTYYEASGSFITTDPSADGTRFLQFKIYINSDGVHTPQIESVTINYNS